MEYEKIEDPETAALAQKELIRAAKVALKRRYEEEDRQLDEMGAKWDQVLSAFKATKHMKVEAGNTPSTMNLQDLILWIIGEHFKHPVLKGQIRPIVEHYKGEGNATTFGSSLDPLKKSGKVVSISFKKRGAKHWNFNWTWWMLPEWLEGQGANRSVRPEYHKHFAGIDFTDQFEFQILGEGKKK